SKAISLKNKYADAYYQRGLAYLDFGEYYKSLSDANELIKLENGKSSRGFFLQGLGNEALKNYEEALVSFSKAINLDSKNADLHVNRATMFFYLMDLDKALKDL